MMGGATGQMGTTGNIGNTGQARGMSITDLIPVSIRDKFVPSKIPTVTDAYLLNADLDPNSYTRRVQEIGKETLEYYTDAANDVRKQSIESGLFTNLSLKQIANNMSVTFVGIIDDIIEGKRSYSELFRQDRIIYIGLLAILIGLAIYIIDLTS
jgi:hypothetical protein